MFDVFEDPEKCREFMPKIFEYLTENSNLVENDIYVTFNPIQRWHVGRHNKTAGWLAENWSNPIISNRSISSLSNPNLEINFILIFATSLTSLSTFQNWNIHIWGHSWMTSRKLYPLPWPWPLIVQWLLNLPNSTAMVNDVICECPFTHICVYLVSYKDRWSFYVNLFNFFVIIKCMFRWVLFYI